MITVNLTKAKQVWRDKIRVDRVAKLAALDILFTKALETNDTVAQAAIVAKKNTWRNAPADPRIDAATTVDELKSAYPAE